MSWHARLALDYSTRQGRTVVQHRHDGPLRVLQSLYPEGDAVCHNVLVHPPGGLVGGDTLAMQVQVASGAHALVSTPGATRFYRSLGERAQQTCHAVLADGARLEWLPLETLAYSGCVAENRLVLQLAPSAELMAWDVSALGLPQAQRPFVQGSLLQHLELCGVWQERGRIAASDQRLLHSPLGLNGHACLGLMLFASGSALPRQRREAAVDAARAVIDAHALQASAAVTAPHPQVLALRALAPLTEPMMDLFKQVWATWRATLWAMPALRPRVWAV